MTNVVPSGDLVNEGAMLRDDNDVPVYWPGLTTTDTKALSGNNTTVDVPIFGVTGSIQVVGLWGIVTTALGANNTAAYWRLNDQTAQVSITASSGTTLSAAPVGSTITKKGLTATALTLISAAAGAISEPAAAEATYFSPFIITQKTGGIATNIEFVYTTTDTPTSGVIKFYLQWLSLATGSSVTPL